MIIGICGKSGSGKSTLARNISKECDSIYVDIDSIGHKVLTFSEVKMELVNSFGDVVSNNIVDRKKLGELVFSSRKKMKVLSDITWKYMQIEIDKIISENTSKVIILDWLLLPKTKYFDMCDVRIHLDIPYEIRKERAIKRDNISSEDFDLRESASIDYILEDFDYVIQDNSQDVVRKLVSKL